MAKYHLGHQKHSFTDMYNSLFEGELNEKIKIPEGSIVANKKTGVEFRVIENNGQGGIYVQPLNKNSGGTWFRETDMVVLKKKSEGELDEIAGEGAVRDNIKAQGAALKILKTAQKGIKKMFGQTTSKSIGRLLQETDTALKTQISEWEDTYLGEAKTVKIVSQGKGESKQYRLMTPSGDELIDMDFDSPEAAKAHAKKKGFKIEEGSTENAAGTLKAIIGTLKKRDDDKAKDMLKMAMGIEKHFKDEGSFSPDQASWIFKMSKMFK